MIDLSSLKTPGWARIVAELHAPAPDDRTFIHKLVAVLAQVSGARQGVLFAVEAGESDASGPEPRPLFIWPTAGSGEQTPEVMDASEARSAARAAADSQQVRVFGLESGSGPFYGEQQEKGYVVAVPVQSGPPEQGPSGPKGVVTLLIEPRSKQALQTTTAMVEVLAGYTLLHATRQQLRRTRGATAALDLAAKLIAALNQTKTFKGAAFQLVNDLGRQIRADRVAIGWVHGIGNSGAARVVAISDTEMIDRRMAMVQKLAAAMDECLDQEQAVLYPPPPAEGEKADVLLSQAITHAHRELAASDARLKVVTLPLRDGDSVVGAVTIESTAAGPADIESVELVQAALDLVTPVLVVRRSDDRNLAARAWTSTLKAGEWLVGPKHTAWKLAGLALFSALVLVTFVKMEYRVEAPIELQPRSRFIVSVPFDGIIASLPDGIEAGKTVKKGDVLVEMDQTDAKLRQLDARSQITQAEREADAYLKAGKLAEAAQARARAEQARAKVALADRDIERSTVVAPIDGVIIAGDLSDKIGSSVKLGDVLFQVAKLEDMVVVAHVSDRDIGLLRGKGAESGPTRGEIATKSDPASGYAFEIERIVPLAQAAEGKNSFEVRGKLAITDAAAKRRFEQGVRPGMEGLAKLETGRHSLLWIGTRRIRDQLRLWLWW